jgi:hypothetical protein
MYQKTKTMFISFTLNLTLTLNLNLTLDLNLTLILEVMAKDKVSWLALWASHGKLEDPVGASPLDPEGAGPFPSPLPLMWFPFSSQMLLCVCGGGDTQVAIVFSH